MAFGFAGAHGRPRGQERCAKARPPGRSLKPFVCPDADRHQVGRREVAELVLRVQGRWGQIPDDEMRQELLMATVPSELQTDIMWREVAVKSCGAL